MLARVERVNGNLAVLAVGGQYMHHVYIVAGDQLVIIGVYLCALYAVFLGGLLGTLYDDVAERNHFNVGQLLQRGHVLAVGYATAADDTNAYLIHC